MTITDLINAIESGFIRISDHADEEIRADHLMLNDILYSVREGEIIEYYPSDRPYPSCLVFGMTSKKEAVHSVWGYNKNNQWAVLITVYRPDPDKWIQWRKRRKEG